MAHTPKMRVLFLCTGNSCRSQMAEGWARALGHGQVESFSAGTEPKGLHPLAVRVMAEAGVDISGQQSKHFDTLVGQPFDYVITVCDRAKDACPVWPGAKEHIHWSFDDPAAVVGTEGERLTVFRRVMFEIKLRVTLFLNAHKIQAPTGALKPIHPV
jgi:arsenate reductase